MIPELYMALIDKIIAATESKKANWSESLISDSVLLHFSDSSIELTHYKEDINEQEHLIVSLLDESGDNIDRFEVYKGDDHFERLYDMYKLARQKVKGVEDKLHKIMAEIELMDALGVYHKKQKSDDLPF